MKVFYIILGIVLALVIASQIFWATLNTETQTYKVIKTDADFEIRLYPPATMASVSLNAKNYKELSSSGFSKLASYIFGGNDANKNIAMTTPVHMDISDSTSTMSFVMPAEYQKTNLPKPNDSSVNITTSAEEYVAVIQFGGYADDESIKKYASQLERALEEQKIAYTGHFRFLGYNAPTQFVGRKNEIIVNVNWKNK
jgi:hypothetical protein